MIRSDDEHEGQGRPRMKVLVLGAVGMLGHKLCQTAARDFDTFAAVRGANPGASALGLPDTVRLVTGVDALDLETVRRAVVETEPGVVVNCVGIVKQADVARDAELVIATNALFPHQLASICGEYDARLVHLSTDCVFSDRAGKYTEKNV